jgi:hypothetical protein
MSVMEISFNFKAMDICFMVGTKSFNQMSWHIFAFPIPGAAATIR